VRSPCAGRTLNREAKVRTTGYSVLVALSDAPDGELRMGELAEAVALSRRRVSRILDTLCASPS